MTGNMERLDDFQEFQGGKVTFGGGEGRITGKGTIRTPILDFENVYYVKELQQFNLFSISQICDKKNRARHHKASLDKVSTAMELRLRAFAIAAYGPLWSKGIKRDCSNAITPQQNGVAERKNKTLIEAARTMLADSKLPTIQSFKPFGCHVTILSPSGLWGSLIGQVVLVNEWYFDLDYLTDTLGYKRDKANQSAGTQEASTNPAGTQDVDSDSECDEQVIIVPSYPSHNIQEAEPKDTSGDEVDDSPLDSAEEIFQQELARLKGQEQRATSDAKDAEELQKRASTKIVPTGSIPVPSGISPVSLVIHRFSPGDVLVPTGGVPVPTGSPTDSFFNDEPTTRVTAEMQQFKFQNVWVLVDLPEGKYAIGTKWILKNKRDARGIVVRNKARLIAQGHRQEEGLLRHEVYALVARIRGNQLMRKYMSLNPKDLWILNIPRRSTRTWFKEEDTLTDFFLKNTKRDIIFVQVYVDDIIFGFTKKAWCDDFEALMKGEFEMSAMGELTFFLGLQVQQRPDGIFISQDKYVQEILKKFDLECVGLVTITYELQSLRFKSLLYSYLEAVKKIFKYLKGQLRLGLWYPRESPFVLEAYSDSDYAGANKDRKSTTSGCQFLGRRLISWQCKKQTIVATSSTEAEYVAAANCCGQESDVYIRFLTSEGCYIRSPELGIDDLPIAEIYSGMDNLGYVTEGKLTFYKNKFSPQWRFLVHTILHCLSTKSGSWALRWPKALRRILSLSSSYRRNVRLVQQVLPCTSAPHDQPCKKPLEKRFRMAKVESFTDAQLKEEIEKIQKALANTQVVDIIKKVVRVLLFGIINLFGRLEVGGSHGKDAKAQVEIDKDVCGRNDMELLLELLMRFIRIKLLLAKFLLFGFLGSLYSLHVHLLRVELVINYTMDNCLIGNQRIGLVPEQKLSTRYSSQDSSRLDVAAKFIFQSSRFKTEDLSELNLYMSKFQFRARIVRNNYYFLVILCTDSRVLRAAGISAIEVLEASRAYWFRALSAICNKFINDFYKSKRYQGSRGFTGILVSRAICYLPQWFRTTSSCFYKGALGAVITYDITRRVTFEKVGPWLKELRDYTNHQDIVVMLVGNKADLGNLRVVSTHEGKAFSEREGLFFMETSALDAQNVNKAFTEASLSGPALQQL
ncbi:putative ribonuclease H-like domain-containing protein [Tanacetum coccineum]